MRECYYFLFIKLSLLIRIGVPILSKQILILILIYYCKWTTYIHIHTNTLLISIDDTGRQGISKVRSQSRWCDNNRRISRGLLKGRSGDTVITNVRHRPLMFTARENR